jgi:hypothetical protein
VNEDEMLGAIRRMVDAEHELRRGLADGTSVDPAATAKRISELEVSLDQCWDLLRQRRAKLEFHADPDQARIRPADVVERYWS